MIPLKLSEVLRVTSPRKVIHQTNTTQNRFAILARDRSHSTDRRNRSASVKRRHDNDDSTDNGANADNGNHNNMDNMMIIVLDNETVTGMTDDMNAALNTVTRIQNCLSNDDISAPLKEALGGITEIMGYLGKVTDALVKSAKPAQLVLPPQTKSYASVAAKDNQNGSGSRGNSSNNAKRGRIEPQTDTPGPTMIDLSKIPQTRTDNPRDGGEPETTYQRKKKAFAKTVAEAEKSSLIFNLNMGKTPVMNPATMQKNAALALSDMAAKTEGGKTSTPSQATIDTLDDAISMVKKVSFYGRTTKTYRNPKDANSGAYCTIPVRYDFQDRKQKILVEDVLKDKCGVTCTTPYPLILRECIKRAYTSVKKVYPDNGVKLLVDTDKMQLKIARKPKNSQTWYYKTPVDLPHEVLDVMARKLPENFEFEITVPRTPTKDDAPTIEDAGPEA